MKKITFNKISIKNFLSIGETPVKIDFKTGVNFITGENRDVPETKNAIGKTTITQAFNFAIFGNSLKGLTKDQMVNNITKGKTEVVLSFRCESPKGNNDFIITRTLNPSSLKVTKDGRDKSRDSIPNTTKYILEVISGTQEIFKNCVIMQANNTVPFMAQGKVEKKKFIESLFNLDIINKMFKLVKDDINLNKRDLEVETKLLNQIENNINTYKDKLQTQESIAQSDIANLQNKIDENLRKIKEVQIEIEELNKEKASLPDNSTLIAEINKELEKYSKAETKLNKDLRKIISNVTTLSNFITSLSSKSKTCPTCNRPYDKEYLEGIDNEIAATKEKLKDAKAKEKELNKFADIITTRKDDAKKRLYQASGANQQEVIIDGSIKVKKSQISGLESLNNSLNQQINSITNINTDPIKELISSAEKEKEASGKTISGLQKTLSKLDIARFILSEEGVRAYIIKKLLDLLNFRVKYYLSKMNSQYSLSFNEVFEDEIKNKNNFPIAYGNLSGAEGKMLDLACIWAFKDILKLQGSVEYNISFYDEILDSSLDAKNSEIICNILNEFAQKEKQSIYLISHKIDFIKAINGEVINLVKEGGITTTLGKKERN